MLAFSDEDEDEDDIDADEADDNNDVESMFTVLHVMYKLFNLQTCG